MTNRWPIIIISLLFLVKALLFSFYLTPLWDIPDEFAHFAYVRDIAQGRGIPLLGESEIQADIIAHVTNGVNTHSRQNWIAQHPPIYHLIAAIPLRIGLCLTEDQEILFRLPRIISAISSFLALLVVYRLLTLVGLKNVYAVAITTCLGVLPMFTHMSSGTNHDTTLLLFSTLATYFWVKYIFYKNFYDAYWCALWLALASTTKMTALVVLVPMVTVIWLEMEGNLKLRLLNAVNIGIIALSLPSLWLLRNFIYFGNPFYNATTDSPDYLEVPLDDSLWQYLSDNPVINEFVKNYIGLIGWGGTAGGRLYWFQVTGLPQSIFSVFIFLAILAILAYLVYSIFNKVITRSNSINYNKHILKYASIISLVSHFSINNLPRQFLIYSSISLGAVLGISFLQITNSPTDFFGQLRIATVALMIFSFPISIVALCFQTSTHQRLIIYSCLTFLFFSTILLIEIYEIYLKSGAVKATHGRFYYVVLPIMLASFGIAIDKLNFPKTFMVVSAIILTLSELQIFLAQVIPFYNLI